MNLLSAQSLPWLTEDVMFELNQQNIINAADFLVGVTYFNYNLNENKNKSKKS